MPFLGIGLHVLVALYFAVHALRNGQQLFWLIILFSFPLLGSLVYFVVIYLPNSHLEVGARKVVATAARTLDPGRELREARLAFDYTPTAQNQMRLAAALLAGGAPEEAVNNYQACLTGPFAADLDIRLAAARACLACSRWSAASDHLAQIRRADPGYRPEAVALLVAQAHAGAGEQDLARAEFAAAASRFGSFESRAEYAIWAASHGGADLAAQLRADLQRTMDRWNRHTRDINAALVNRLNDAFRSKR